MLEVVMDQETQKVFDMTAAAVEAEEQGLDSSFEGGELGMLAAVGSDAMAGTRALQLLQHAHQWNHESAAETATAGTAASAAAGGGPAGSMITAAVGLPGKPLLWVGYDASAYAVAKSAVLVEMMMQGADDGAALQVRYSSAWSHDTKAAFMAALSVLLDEHRGGDHPSVVGMLCHWRSHHDVSLAASRSAWLDSVSKTKADIGGLKRKEDRLAYMHYIFTGVPRDGTALLCCSHAALPAQHELGPRCQGGQSPGPAGIQVCSAQCWRCGSCRGHGGGCADRFCARVCHCPQQHQGGWR